MRRFNTAGPCDPERHYLVPPEARLPTARQLAEQGGYFVVHAPRQTGKTTLLRTLAVSMTAEGTYAALYATCETGEPARDDYVAAQEAVLAQIAASAARDLPAELRPPALEPGADLDMLGANLRTWALRCPRPVVLLLDEIDALRGESLRSILRQLRAGYPDRPDRFPWSVALCGLRDVRGYRSAGDVDPARLGTSSPFNVKVESLRLADFSRDDVEELLAQHTAETGQAFSEAARARIWDLAVGQPWLTNALARQVVERLDLPTTAVIEAAHVDRAKEAIILARQTHLDSLAARLMEPRVKRLMEPLIAGDSIVGDATYQDDVAYVRDLGLVAPDAPLRIANPIYREVVVRVLSQAAEDNVTVEPRSFVADDGRLDFERVLAEFADWWVEHGEVLSQHAYHEVAPHLVLMAWLQRIVNGGGYVDREYGVGRGRVDLLVRWPHVDARGRDQVQREALELKLWRDGQPDPVVRGLRQLDGYLERLGVGTGVLVVFDRRGSAPPLPDRTGLSSVTSPAGRQVTLLRA